MASLKELHKQIETVKIEQSKCEELKGPNVRTPSLIPGQFYLGRGWKVTTEGSDNPWLALRFVGSGSEHENPEKEGVIERVLNVTNPRIKDMQEGDFYFFERFIDGKIGQMNAYQSDECLVFGDPPVRLTFFEIKNVTQQVKPVKPAKAAKTEKAEEPKTGTKTAAKTPAKKKTEAKTDATSPQTETVTEGATPHIGAVEASEGFVESNTEHTVEAVAGIEDQPDIIEHPSTIVEEGEIVPPVAEQSMPEAIADNADRSIEDLDPIEEDQVQEAIESGKIEK